MTDYELLAKQIQALAETERDYVPVLSNASALLYEAMDDINWAGFYLMDNGSLLLGPFQGKTACIRIEPGKGVCGTAVEQGRALRVDDVHEFPGHIACDSASESEIVIPIRSGGRTVGVLDIDSPIKARFDAADESGLSGFVAAIEAATDFTRLRL